MLLCVCVCVCVCECFECKICYVVRVQVGQGPLGHNTTSDYVFCLKSV